jgi:hypothetical protein
MAACRDARSFTALFEMAEELRQTLIPLNDIERAKLVSEIVRDRDMVYGVWPDENEAYGFGVQIIKGDAIIPYLEGFETNDELSIAAIPCVGLEQALAARDEWGRVEEPDKETPDAQISARPALALAEAARLVWIASRNGR